MSSFEEALEVVAAVIQNASGQILIARRPEHVHQGGLWEYPGGKVESGETAEQALQRELWEELGIRPSRYRRLIRIPHHYPDRSVLLDVWQVEAFEGEPVGRQGQPLQWVQPQALLDYSFPAANQPITSAARLPAQYLITPDCHHRNEFLAALETALAQGARLVQLRTPSLPVAEFEQLAQTVIQRCHAQGAAVLLNSTPEAALRLGADGVHLNSHRLQALQERPVPRQFWCSASCHNLAQLRQAQEIGVDFAVLSPLQATASHPQAVPLGWSRFQELVWDLPLPVYALGGLSKSDLPRAQAARAQGVAGIRAFWPSTRAASNE